MGLWCLAGLLGFLVLEKLFIEEEKDDKGEKSKREEKEEELSSEKEEKVNGLIK